MDEPLDSDPRHCDNIAEDFSQPKCLRWFIFVNRLPAVLKPLVREKAGGNPVLYAKYQGEWYRAVMASRMGDIGITKNLDAENGYDKRVNVEDLSDFTDIRPKDTK